MDDDLLTDMISVVEMRLMVDGKISRLMVSIVVSRGVERVGN